MKWKFFAQNIPRIGHPLDNTAHRQFRTALLLRPPAAHQGYLRRGRAPCKPSFEGLVEMRRGEVKSHSGKVSIRAPQVPCACSSPQLNQSTLDGLDERQNSMT